MKIDRQNLADQITRELNVDGNRIVTQVAHKGDFTNAKLIAEMRTPLDKITTTERALDKARGILGVKPENGQK